MVKNCILAYTYGVNEGKSKTSKELETVNILVKSKQKRHRICKTKPSEYNLCVNALGNIFKNQVSEGQKEKLPILVDNGVTLIIGTSCNCSANGNKTK